MHLSTIVAFMVLFWRAEEPRQWILLPEGDILWSLSLTIFLPVGVGAAAWWSARRTRRLLSRNPAAPLVAQQFHHRSTLFLRIVTVLGFGLIVLTTRWAGWFALGRISPALQIAGDVLVLAPFLLCVLGQWLAAYPLDRALRMESGLWPDETSAESGRRGTLGAYLDFNLRHQILVVAVPMLLILFAANMTRGYERGLRNWSGWFWMPDAVLGAVAVVVFVMSPLLLCRIWRTEPLEDGPLRARLEAVGRRSGLRFRDLLVWRSDGMMINAAVMGLLAPVRYVLLSDGLLATMNVDQIEAVFGHEAGHVRHRHIQHFLLFALAGWFLVVGLMDLLVRTVGGADSEGGLSDVAIQGIGVGATVLLWGVGFGWLSRRFEREADLFGARCVTPGNSGCRLPCSVHVDEGDERSGPGRVCATGAAVFASALDRVAVLNGIPHEERSWRHSSIGSRIRFLTSLAGDPLRAARFERLVRRARLAVLGVVIVGSAVSVYYWSVMPVPRP